RAALARVLAPMTAIAAASPHAWFPVARDAGEIVTPTADNRMVAYPYTKLMTSIMDVDMAAPRHGRGGRARAGGRRHRHRRRGPPRPLLLLRQLGVLRARRVRDRPGRPS